VQEVWEPPAPNSRIVLEELAVPAQKAFAVRALESWDAEILPLLSPRGMPAHDPGVPGATLTQAATPLAWAAAFCSISPRDQARDDGEADDFVGI
jgi:hypothetical protein